MKKVTPIAAIFIMVTLLSMPLIALAAGSQSITRTFEPTADAAQLGGDDNGFETNPSYAYADDANSATDTNSGDSINSVAADAGTDKHSYYNYGMAEIPDGSTINGITVRADIAVDDTVNSPFTAIRLSWDGGSTWTAVKSQTLTAITEITYTYGGSTDNWGRTWSVSELSDANFRLQVINGDTKNQNSLRDFSLDYIPVSITFTPVWESYQDSARTTVWGDTGTEYDATYRIVYMKGTGFLDGAETYNVGYYDADDTKRATDNGIALVSVSGGRGTLGNTSDPYEPNYDLTSPPAAAGTWHAVVQPSGATAFPSDYSTLSGAPDDYKLIADDTFTVEASAIPEFPTVMAAIGVAGLCYGIYFWMRKRYQMVEVRI